MKGYRRFFDPDILLMAILGAFGVGFYMDARSYNPTAALFPKLISVISLIFIVWTIAIRIHKLSRAQPDTGPREEGPVQKMALSPYLSVATMVTYFLLIYVLGFTLVSLLYLLVIPILLGYRKYAIIFIVGMGWIIGFKVVFNYVLHARIPEGLLEGTFRWLMQ